MLSSGWATIWESMRSTGGEGEGMGGELWLSDCTRLSGVIMTTQRFTQCLAKEPSVRKGGETYADPFNCWQNRGTLRSSGFLNSVGWLGKEQSQINVNRISFFSEGSCGILGTQLSCSTYAFPFLSIFEASVTQGCLKNARIWIYLLSTVGFPDLSLSFSCTSLLFYVRIYSQTKTIYSY